MVHCRCSSGDGLDGLISPYHYADPFLRRLIKDFKYHGATEIGKALDGLVSVGAHSCSTLFPAVAAVVPMPLHPRRERMRGFNQAERLAAAVAETLSLRMEKPLKRVKATDEQARLKLSERHANCLSAFLSTPLCGDYILVDDVVTTGATMKAAAMAMKAAGAHTVIGFALAHGSGDELAD